MPTASADYQQLITWRLLNDKAVLRYVCLFDLRYRRYAVAVADLLSGLPTDDSQLCSRVAKRLLDAHDTLKWFETATAAMDAHDASI
jgi:hypothetical protein